MDFEKLFADLTGQLDDEIDRESRFQEEDEERQRQANLLLIERVRLIARANAGGVSVADPSPISVHMHGGHRMSAFPQTCGKDWFLAEVIAPAAIEGSFLIPMSAVQSIEIPKELAAASVGTKQRAPDSVDRAQPPHLADQISVGFVLRDLARRRSNVVVRTRSEMISGVVDRVGRDHLEITQTRDVGTTGTRNTALLIPLSAVVMVGLP